MTCLDKLARPIACLGTLARPSSMTCLRKVHRPSACLDMVTRPSVMPSKGDSALCMPRHGASA